MKYNEIKKKTKDELIDLYNDYNKDKQFKTDPIEINKKLLKNFNRFHPLFSDLNYVNNKIQNEGYEILI